jgi:Protein of unknown function (DUF1203)
MTAFRCVAMPTETAERFRCTGVDDSDNTLRRMEAPDTGRFPCRHCLRFASAGETMLLGSYNLPAPRGIYWTPSPIFVHAEPCTRYVAHNEVAPIAGQDVLVSVRAYDRADQCIYDLGQVALGAAVDAPLARALDDPRTAFVNVHTAKPGCWLFRVERVGSPLPGL